MRKQTCATCGECFALEVAEKKRKYCTWRCRPSTKQPTEKRKFFGQRADCLGCKRDFEKRSPSHRYCDECVGARTKERERAWAAKVAAEREYEKRACVECGTRFSVSVTDHQQKYCSRDCQRVVGNRRQCERQKQKGSQSKRELVKCLYCSKEFRQRFAGNSAYCSKKCKGSDWAQKNKGRLKALTIESEKRRVIARQEFCPVWFPACEGCGQLFRARREGMRWCNNEDCIRERSRRAYHEKYAEATGARNCIECGAEFQPGGATGNVYVCGEICREANRKRNQRISRAKRRAVERGVESDRIDPCKVFERDGWRCHICGDKLRWVDRNKNLDRSPEVDHIVPLAAGGTHTWENVAAACRKRNGEKGARPPRATNVAGDNEACQPVSLQH